MDEHHPPDPHWYLFFIGTCPGWQSRGSGSALMRPVLETCDRESLPAYLEASTERNRPLYLRHGFGLTVEPGLPDGPPMWSMWREAGAPGSVSAARGERRAAAAGHPAAPNGAETLTEPPAGAQQRPLGP